MKLYRVVTRDNSEFEVKADSYTAIDGKYLFCIDGKPIQEFFFTTDSVVEITVQSENVKRDRGEKPRFWKRFIPPKSGF